MLSGIAPWAVDAFTICAFHGAPGGAIPAENFQYPGLGMEGKEKA
jgi:hypothetical protein